MEMRVRVRQEDLEATLSLAGRCVPSRTTIPVMKHVLIRAYDDHTIEIGAANGVTSLRIAMAGRVEVAGGCTVPADHLIKLIGTLSEDPVGDVTLTLEGGELYVEGDSAKAHFKTMPADEFPRLDEWNDESPDGSDLLAAELQAALDHVAPSASSSEAFPKLNGVQFRFDGETLFLAATDGKRVSRTVIFGVTGYDGWDMIVPPEAIELIRRLDAEDVVDFQIEGQEEASRLVLAAGPVLIGTSLIDGNYPDVERIFRSVSAEDLSVLVGREEMRRAVQRGLIFGANNESFLVFDVQDDMLVVGGRDMAGGGESVVAAKTEGLVMKFGMNGKLVDEFLRVATTPHIQFFMISPTSPVRWQEVDGDDDFLHVIMPMEIIRS